MHILSSVKIWGTTSTNTIVAKDLNSTFFEDVIGDKVVEVVGGEVVDRAAVGELDFRAGWANNDWTLFVFSGFELGERSYEWLRSPVFDQFIDFLKTLIQIFPWE